MTYNYFPEDINSDDVMKMRFELADTDVSKDEMSAALSDEEITAVLEQYPDINLDTAVRPIIYFC